MFVEIFYVDFWPSTRSNMICVNNSNVTFQNEESWYTAASPSPQFINSSRECAGNLEILLNTKLNIKHWFQ